MIKKEAIRRTIKTFKEWDNNNMWDKPKDIFTQHTLQKSENALKTAKYILRIMEDSETKDLFDAEDYDGALWIINASYYRIFFMATCCNTQILNLLSLEAGIYSRHCNLI